MAGVCTGNVYRRHLAAADNCFLRCDIDLLPAAMIGKVQILFKIRYAAKCGQRNTAEQRLYKDKILKNGQNTAKL